MWTIRFDVNDAGARERFDKIVLPGALLDLTDGSQPQWGRMTPHQMVEHLAWTYGVSTGKHQVDCRIPEEDRPRLKRFLYAATPTPKDFANPAFGGGLPQLKHQNLTAARAALDEEIAAFWNQRAKQPATVHVHPLFGPIGVEEWSRTHFKHGCHHLSQFGLIELHAA